MIPVEDLGDGFDEAGTVGQEVYGAGIAFSTVARTSVRAPGSDVEISCEYPFEVLEQTSSRVRLRFYGDPRLEARVRVDFPPVDGEGARWRDIWVAGGEEVTIPLHERVPAATS